jgi:hypothetical protein
MVNIGFLEELFDEKIIKVMKFFIDNKQREIYLREISSGTSVSPASTFRIINKFLKIGIIDQKQIKKFKFYIWAKNQKTEVLESLFVKDALTSFVEQIKGTPGINQIILYGKKKKDQTDLFIIGEGLNKEDITKVGAQIKSDFGFNINFVIFEPEQFSKMTELGLYAREKKTLWKTI